VADLRVIARCAAVLHAADLHAADLRAVGPGGASRRVAIEGPRRSCVARHFHGPPFAGDPAGGFAENIPAFLRKPARPAKIGSE
jgi:hypothetical protein